MALVVYLLVVAGAMLKYFGPVDERWDGWRMPPQFLFLAIAFAGLPLFAALCIVMRPR